MILKNYYLILPILRDFYSGNERDHDGILTSIWVNNFLLAKMSAKCILSLPKLVQTVFIYGDLAWFICLINWLGWDSAQSVQIKPIKPQFEASHSSFLKLTYSNRLSEEWDCVNAENGFVLESNPPMSSSIEFGLCFRKWLYTSTMFLHLPEHFGGWLTTLQRQHLILSIKIQQFPFNTWGVRNRDDMFFW